MKHTPGPWRKGIASAREVYDPKSGHTICRASVADAFPDVLWEANARLIAASPDLLKALKEQIEPRAKGWKVTDWDIRDANARAAIAKAEGRTP